VCNHYIGDDANAILTRAAHVTIEISISKMDAETGAKLTGRLSSLVPLTSCDLQATFQSEELNHLACLHRTREQT
jgi:hypothetical protein